MVRRSGYFNLILKIAFLLAVVAMLVQFFFNRSLWIDEAMLALNIMGKSFPELLKPLDNYQVAPILFLWIEKAVITLFGSSEMALRFFPFLCSLASLVLIYRLSVAFFDNRVIALTAMALLGLSPSFIYYSSEVKQYACDMFVLLVIYYSVIMILRSHNSFQRRASDGDKLADGSFHITNSQLAGLTALGSASVFLSNVSVIALVAAGSMLLYKEWLGSRRFARLFIPLSAWMVCFVVNYFLFIRNHPYTAYMQNYWRESFMPVQSFSELFHWAPRKISQLFYELLPSGPWKRFYVVTIALYLIGLAQLFSKRKFDIIFLCVAPIVIHLALSGARIYPFDLRLTLYLEPLLLIVIAYGMYQSASALFVHDRAHYIFIALLWFVISLAIVREFPIKREELRPVLERMSNQIAPDDSIYVYYNAGPVFQYYQATGHTRFNDSSIVYGKRRTDDERHYLGDIDGLHGRVWFVFSHIYPRSKSEVMEQNMVDQLLQSGTKAAEVHGYGSSAYLFNLR